MNDMHFINPRMFQLLWLLPPLLLLFSHAAVRRRKALAAFIDPALAGRNGRTARPAQRTGRFVLFCLAMAAMIIALARPAWNLQETQVTQTGRDLVFMIDVSKSMLANDLMPNRLERAKLAIRDCVEKLQGDRVALVAFAGTAAIKCPLTRDYGFFLMMLDGIDSTSVEKGGTLLGDALRTGVKEVFDDREKQYKDIILITDGEDHESFPVQAAREAGDAGIRLLIIGLGDDREGQRIPITTAGGQTTFLRYNGQEVWSKLDDATLRQMAEATPGGRYLPVATGTVDLGQVYLDLVAAADRKELGAKTIKRYAEKFQIFLAAALLLLTAEGMISRVLLIGALTLLPLLQPDPCAASGRALVNAGNEAYNSGNYTEAQTYYEKALASAADDPAAEFNMGDSYYRLGKFSEAEKAFDRAIALGQDSDFLARSWFNRGNARFRSAGQKTDPQEKLAEFQESGRCYEKSLQLDKNLAGAGRNLEICRRKIKEIEGQLAEQAKKQQQDARQQQQENPQQPDGSARNQEQQEKKMEQQGNGQQPTQEQKQQGPNRADDTGQQKSKDDAAGQEQHAAGPMDPRQGAPDTTAPGRPMDQQQQDQAQEVTAQTVEAILAAEKKIAEMRRQRLQTAPAAVEKDW